MMRTATAALLGLGSLMNAMALPQGGVNPSSVATATIPGVSAPPQYTPDSQDLDGACGKISGYESRFVKRQGSSVGQFPVDAKTAFDCLMSIPLEKEPVLEFLFQLSKFMQFESTITYLQNPPENSGQDPMDILGGLSDLYNAVESGSITQYYELETRVDKLLGGCHEGHLYVNWVLPTLLSFNTPFKLLDASVDGTELSKVYVFEDTLLEEQTKGRFNASAITHIDGEDVITAIEKIMYYDSSQSPDTRWNGAFISQNPPKDGSFYGRLRFPGALTFILTFENGTSVEYEYGAVAYTEGAGLWQNLETGQDIWDKLINIPPTDGTDAKKLKIRAIETSKQKRDFNSPEKDIKRQLEKRQSGVPRQSELVEYGGDFPDTPGVEPWIRDINNVVGGYFMADYNNDDSKTAVIDITGFAPDDTSASFAPHAVQAAVELFLKECKKRGMEKLVIDVRGNGGGYVNMGYDMLAQLFPGVYPYAGTRLRYHPASLRIAQAFTQIISQEVIDDLTATIGKTQGETLSASQADLYNIASYASLSGLNQYFNLDSEGKPFETFDDFFGPHAVYNDQFTNILTADLNGLLAVGDLSYDITGYGDRADMANNEQIFGAENIVLVTDGVCASTCAIFSESLRTQHGVRTVVIGGRPQNAPAAHTGGTRGTQIIKHSQMLEFVKIVENNYTPRDQNEADEWETIFPRSWPLNVADAAVNWKDNIRRSDPTETPLQFYLEAADCRLFYTKSSVLYSHEVWDKVDHLAWGNDDSCAWGSLKNVNPVTANSNGVPTSIGSNNPNVGTNSGSDNGPLLTGDFFIDSASFIWSGVPQSLGPLFGRRP